MVNGRAWVRPVTAGGLARLPAVLAVVLVAAAYYGTGRLGLLLAIPPGYATAVWPPSGIALAATLLFGYRVGPGIWLGSFLVNVSTSFDPTSAVSIMRSVALPAGIGVGAALQAITGAVLIRRVVGFPTPLDRDRDVVTFLLLGAPVSCLVGATIGVTTLLLYGVIAARAYAFTWWTWWVGDAIGVLIVTPLVLIWTAEPREAWRRRRIPVAVPLCGAFAVAIVFFMYASAVERNRARLEFERQGAALAHTLRAAFDGYLDDLRSIESLFASSSEVDRPSFRTFVQHPLTRHPGIQALSWNVRVPDAERAAFEARTRREGYPDFRITERNAAGQIVPASRRAEYVTVHYIEPYARNISALGFDAASQPTRLAALNRARDTGTAVATGRVTLVQETDDQAGVLIALPIYENNRPRGTVEERRQNLRGYAVGVFRIGDMVEAPLKPVGRADIELQLVDETGPVNEPLLSVGSRPASNARGRLAEDDAQKAVGLEHGTVIDMAGRRWALRFFPTAEYLAARLSWAAWTVLAVALLFSGLLGAFLLVVTGRTARIEQLMAARRRAEEGLAESERLVRTIVETEPECVHLLAADGTVMRMNRAGLAMFEAESPTQLIGTSVFPLVTPEHRHAVRALTEHAFGGTAGRLAFDVVGLKGTRRSLETHMVPFQNPSGEIVASLGITRDITVQKRLEGELRQAQKMEAIGRLAGGIAHDFNNLLTVIVGRSERLASRLSPADPLHRDIGLIQQTAARATSLTRQLLAFSRKQVLQPQIVDLNTVVVGLAPMLGRLIREDIEVVVLPAPDLEGVYADPGQLEQMIINLAINARDAMPNGGTLTLETANVDLDEARPRGDLAVPPGQYVVLRVGDSGVGMSAETQQHLFEPFFTTKDPGAGTGLGLAVVYGIVRQSGGHVSVSSVLGQGTRFGIYLPRVQAAAKGAALEPLVEPARGSETILLVEDQKDVREMIHESLLEHGYTVLAAASGGEALWLAERHRGPIALLLTDVVMPGMSGTDLAERLATVDPSLKILYMSGHAPQAATPTGRAGSAAALLRKPFTPTALAWKVREVLDGGL